MANLRRGIIVSCQAVKGEPLFDLGIMKHFAYAAVEGGAVGIRANYVNDINDIMTRVDVPVIGIIKAVYPQSDVYITPTLKEVRELLENTKCQVIALDCTRRDRPNSEQLADLVAYIRKNAPTIEIMADCSDFQDAQMADKLGFDYIGSTMRGYTSYTTGMSIPDCDFLRKLVTSFPERKIIAEGGIWEREQLREVSRCGVYSIVIGSSITRPKDITQRFVEALELC
ncbi:MAG: N-acetylmannosamine-6-phosphate 2-epimerase [Clostridia bacterium]